jgi:hypothetical protein
VGESARLTRAEISVLQAALAAEQAAAYGYGGAGAHLSGGPGATAAAGWQAHLKAADTLTGLLEAAGVTPVPAPVAYRLPRPVTGAAAATALAAALEDQVTSAYLAVVGHAGSALRTLAAGQARAAALRAAAWRGSTVAFPGLSGAALSAGRTGPPGRSAG